MTGTACSSTSEPQRAGERAPRVRALLVGAGKRLDRLLPLLPGLRRVVPPGLRLTRRAAPPGLRPKSVITARSAERRRRGHGPQQEPTSGAGSDGGGLLDHANDGEDSTRRRPAGRRPGGQELIQRFRVAADDARRQVRRARGGDSVGGLGELRQGRAHLRQV